MFFNEIKKIVNIAGNNINNSNANLNLFLWLKVRPFLNSLPHNREYENYIWEKIEKEKDLQKKISDIK